VTPLLDKVAAAAALHVTPRVVLRLVRAKQIAAVRVGRAWRFEARDLEAFVEAQKQRAARDVAVTPYQPREALPMPRRRRFQ
jgi:excisionase family DNA binding protein